METARHPPCAAPRRPRGFTLLELMATITIAAVILGFGIPSFQDFIRSSRITGAANEFLAAAYLARGEAIKRRASTVLCMSTNPLDEEEPDCDGDGSQGWIVFVDDADPDVVAANDRDGVRQAGEEILLRHDALHPAVDVRLGPDGNEGYVSYSPAGMMRELAAVGTQMSVFVLCDERGNVSAGGEDDSAARAILISPIGRPRVTRSVAEIAGGDVGGCP